MTQTCVVTFSNCRPTNEWMDGIPLMNELGLQDVDRATTSRPTPANADFAATACKCFGNYSRALPGREGFPE